MKTEEQIKEKIKEAEVQIAQFDGMFSLLLELLIHKETLEWVLEE